MIRGKRDEAGTRKFAEGLCYGGRVDAKPRGKIGCLHRPNTFRNIPEVGHFPGGKSQTVMDLHGIVLCGDHHEYLVCIQILFHARPSQILTMDLMSFREYPARGNDQDPAISLRTPAEQG